MALTVIWDIHTYCTSREKKEGIYKKLEEKGFLNVKGPAVLSPRVTLGCCSGCFRTSPCHQRTSTSSGSNLNRSRASQVGA